MVIINIEKKSKFYLPVTHYLHTLALNVEDEFRIFQKPQDSLAASDWLPQDLKN